MVKHDKMSFSNSNKLEPIRKHVALPGGTGPTLSSARMPFWPFLQLVKAPSIIIFYAVVLLLNGCYVTPLTPTRVLRSSCLGRPMGNSLVSTWRSRTQRPDHSGELRVLTCRAKGDSWKDAPTVDPFDEHRMEAKSTHAINWCVKHRRVVSHMSCGWY